MRNNSYRLSVRYLRLLFTIFCWILQELGYFGLLGIFFLSDHTLIVKWTMVTILAIMLVVPCVITELFAILVFFWFYGNSISKYLVNLYSTNYAVIAITGFTLLFFLVLSILGYFIEPLVVNPAVLRNELAIRDDLNDFNYPVPMSPILPREMAASRASIWSEFDTRSTAFLNNPLPYRWPDTTFSPIDKANSHLSALECPREYSIPRSPIPEHCTGERRSSISKNIPNRKDRNPSSPLPAHTLRKETPFDGVLSDSTHPHGTIHDLEAQEALYNTPTMMTPGYEMSKFSYIDNASPPHIPGTPYFSTWYKLTGLCCWPFYLIISMTGKCFGVVLILCCLTHLIPPSFVPIVFALFILSLELDITVSQRLMPYASNTHYTTLLLLFMLFYLSEIDPISENEFNLCNKEGIPNEISPKDTLPLAKMLRSWIFDLCYYHKYAVHTIFKPVMSLFQMKPIQES
ncbi:hypothetical protein NEOKW01_0296 [Nematocida sp. AWRm80]|nr:hypothetical protein NEOKW01_0296 [Nematocida sp. AWRm80]